MEIYNAIFAVTLIGVIIEVFFRKVHGWRKCIWFYISSVLIVGSVAFRGEYMGIDTQNYMNFFKYPNDFSNHYLTDTKEPGLSIINAFIRLFTHNKFIYSGIIAVLSYIPILIYIKKYSVCPSFSIFLILSFSIGTSLYLLSFPMFRQMIALSLFAVILLLYEKSEYKINKAIVIVFIIMFLIHFSSLLVLLLYFTRNTYISKRQYAIISVLACLSGFFVGTYAPEFQYYAAYFEKDFYLTSIIEFKFISLVPYLGTFLLCLYIFPEKKCNTLYVKGFFLSVVLLGLMSFFGNNVDRMCLYFNLLSYVAIPQLFKALQSKDKYVYLCTLICFLGYFTYKYYKLLDIFSDVELCPLVPYQSCF